MGEISNIIAGGDKNINKIKKYGKYPVIANSINKNGIVGYYDNEYRVKAPAVTVTGRGEIGHAVARFQNFTPIVRLLALSSKLDPIFLANSINKIRFFNESTGVPQLTKPQLSTYSIIIPSVEEQNNIGKLILLVEKYIHLQQRKLRQLNFIRQGLTQNLFPDKDKIKPKVQFKGYKENWKITKAKNIFTEVDIRELPDRVILSTTQTGKVVTRSSLGRNLLFSKDKLKNYKLVLPGQFIIHLRSFKGGFATSELSGIVSPTYTIFDFKDRKQNDSNFRSILFTHYNFIQSLKSITEGIRYNGVTIKFNQFADLKITYPDLEIQSRLSQLIQCLDADIKKQKLKIQKFKKVKQFLLQNMFT